MSLTGVKNAIPTGAAAVETLTKIGQWVGRNVQIIGKNAAIYAQKAWTVFTKFLVIAKEYTYTYGNYVKANLIKGFYASRVFVLANQPLCMGIGIGIAATVMLSWLYSSCKTS